MTQAQMVKKPAAAPAVKAEEKAKTQDIVEPTTFRMPLADIIEDDNEFIIHVDMPGVSEDEIEIEFQNGNLMISGEIKKEQKCTCTDEKCGRKYKLRQFSDIDFSRSFWVGNSINENGIKADYQNGVLTVHLPKSEEVKPHKIPITK